MPNLIYICAHPRSFRSLCFGVFTILMAYDVRNDHLINKQTIDEMKSEVDEKGQNEFNESYTGGNLKLMQSNSNK